MSMPSSSESGSQYRQTSKAHLQAVEEPAVKVEAASEPSDDDAPLRRVKSRTVKPKYAAKLRGQGSQGESGKGLSLMFPLS